VATLGPLPAILPVTPSLAKLIEVDGRFFEETVKDIPLNLRVYPSNYPVEQAKVDLFENGVLRKSVIVPLVAGRAVYTIQHGFQKESGSLVTAVPSFTAGQNEAQGHGRVVQFSSPMLVVDSNNDTVVGLEHTQASDQDEAAARAKKPLTFWQSQVDQLSIPGDLDDWKRALEDYATVIVRLRDPLPTGEKLALRMTESLWHIARKVTSSELGSTIPLSPTPDPDCVNERKLHLCHDPSATYQAQTIRMSLGDEVPANPPAAEVERRPKYRGHGVIELHPLSLALRENEFLFSCDRACAEKLEVGRIGPSGAFEPLTEVKVDFRPLRDRFSVFSVREGGADGGRPLANAIPLSDSDHVPPDTQRLLVLTHGFVVPTPGAVEHFFPQYLRRLYWTDVPVLESQRDAQGRKVYTVGFTWPSQLGPGFSGDLFFPEAEYAALQSGVPFARLLEDWKTGANGLPRRIDVLAHSLGNIVTNSALMQMPAGVVDQLVMHEPALAAEAFDYNYQYSAEDKSDQWPAAIRLGYEDIVQGIPRDRRWMTEWQDILDGKSVPSLVSPNPLPVQLSEQRWCLELDSTTSAPRPFYFYRWRQHRPDDPRVSQPAGNAMQCGGLAPLPQRGPWLGFFASNRQKTRIVNTFSGGDKIVGDVWSLSQSFQKPNMDPLIGGQAEEERIAQFWAGLGIESMETEQYLWPEGAHSDLVRQWRELAYWFPPLSRAAGHQAVPALENRGLTSLVQDLPVSLDRTTTHSFATHFPLAQVWDVHRVFRDLLR